jgi:hypothetical protein
MVALRRRVWIVFAIFVWAGVLHQALWASCASTIDIPGTPTAGNFPIKLNHLAGQTFKAPGTGCIALGSVTFSVQKQKSGAGAFGDLIVRIYTTTGLDLHPGLAIAGAVATADTTGVTLEDTLYDVTATFSTPVSLVGGTTYAVIVSSISTTGSAEWELGLLTNAYADGKYWQSGDGSAWAAPVGGSKDVKLTLCFAPCRSGGCTLTQGYWKNHADAWPVTSLTLGTLSYTKAQLLSILDTPVVGNSLISLAHQLIAAKLNIANGADGSTISSTIASADALIGTLVIPPVGSGFLGASSVDTLVLTLTAYNEGTIGPGHCN